MRALGIDFGERRIGLALSDADGRWALPWRTIERRTDRRAIHQIADLARQEEISLLVIGEPRRWDGTAGSAVERVRRFGERLARVTGLPVRWVDETLTTVEARERLRAAWPDDRKDRRIAGPRNAGPRNAGPRNAGPRNAGPRDAVAAQILLQEALDQGAGTS